MIVKYNDAIRRSAQRNYKHLIGRNDLKYPQEIQHLCWLAANGMAETWLIYEMKYNAKNELTKD